jgi:hypothetical protein
MSTGLLSRLTNYLLYSTQVDALRNVAVLVVSVPGKHRHGDAENYGDRQ